MPSIEQCDVASGSVAALPSTLEIFDKFKPIMDNGKDSDSEESFHLLLEDDDIENQSVTSEGKGKENHNEETEDEILNKFETLPSGTPDHIDPHIEDSILNDTDEDNVESNKENEPKPDKNQENIQKNNDIISTTEVKITYKFEDYENSCDGEFKSIYETDVDATKEETEKEEEESDKASENVEPMEVSETLPDIDTAKENEVEETVDTFEDGMDMEQDDTNEDIANIIEKLEDQDTPMEEPEVESESVTTAETDLTENDILMAETSEITSEDSKQLEPEQAQNVLDSDVEMTEEETLNTEIEEPHKENEPQEEASTFQDPTEESEDSKAPHSEAVEVQVPVNEENTEAAEESAPCIEEEEEQQQNEDEPSKLEEPISEANKSTEGSEDLSLGIVDEEEQKQTPSIEIQSSSVAEEPEQDLDEAPKESVASIEENNQVEEKEENSQVEEKEENNQVEEKEENNQVEEKEENNQVEEKEENNQVEEKEENNQVEEKEENNQVEEKEENIQVEEKESEIKSTETDDDVFKVPEQPQKDTSDLTNDKPEEDEGDLLDISMVRETDEDDACAIADAIEDNTAMEDTDKETLASEKSDEEQSEKMEIEQEGSDIDKDQDSNDGNDNAMGFDDMDDDSRIDADDNSSNAEAPEEPKDKIIEISESSKDDDSSDNEPKAIKDVATEVENDLDNSAVDDTQLSDDKLVETKEAEEQDDIVIQDGIDSASTKETEEQDDLVIQDGIDSATKETEEQDDIIIQDDIDSSDITDKTDDVSDKAKEIIEAPVEASSEAVCEVSPEEESKDDDSDIRRSSLNKRSHSLSDSETVEVSAKKPKIDEKHAEKETEKLCDSSEAPITENLVDSTPAEKLKTLTAFSSFMKCRKLTAKLSRSDLEQFCIQKICESLMLKSSEGELHQTLKKHEKTIDNLRKDIQQLGKQCKDLEIVNKKLMNELRTQNVMKKPLVPLKITRSVGLQVRLNPGNEVPNQNRRRQPMSNSPQKQTIASPNTNVNRGKTTPGGGAQQPSVVRQIMQASPQKPLTPTTGNNANAPMLSQALQKRPGSVVGKRTTTPVRKPGNPGVIDLTDEDDKQGKASGAGNPIKIINKTMPTAGATNKATGVNKMGAGGKTVGKQVAVSKSIPVGPNKGNTLSQGIRLTPTSVISSSGSGSPQMVYVVPTITSNAGGQQKVAFVNFQPTNGGVLSGTLNGSTVSVMPNKQGQTLTLKTLPGPMRNKHPAPLPTPPRVNLDPKLKPPLPKPLLTIKKIDTGIILQWKMPYNLDLYESIASYQLYAYQETSSPPNTDMWRKVGDVKALALPMACTLTQFADKNKYYFAVRSVDVHKRIGAFSDPEEISL